ncbi:mitochondrial ATP synthase g subunit-domain-containing protein [Panaeolus papilionaceus]|nr:mitochondrial ATP synthase g subunit-domain-containing protein [Panaeolus papilionaceus]
MSTATLFRQTLARQALRQQHMAAQRRFASTSSDAAQKKAQDAFASAQKNAEKVWETVQKLLGPVGEKAGQMLGSYKQPLVYNFAVVKELVKQVYVAEGLKPPTLSAVRAAYAEIWTQLTTAGFARRITQNGEWAQVGIYGLQAYGIYKIGEIIGRRSIVGYNIH